MTNSQLKQDLENLSSKKLKKIYIILLILFVVSGLLFTTFMIDNSNKTKNY